MLLIMNVFWVYHSKQVNDPLCSYNLVSFSSSSSSSSTLFAKYKQIHNRYMQN